MQVTHGNVFKISNVESPVSCSFCPNPSQTYTKSLGLGKCSSHCTSSELFYSRNSEHLLILLWSLGSAGHPLLLLAFIVSKWIAIPSRKKELTFLFLLMYLLFLMLCVVFHCSLHRDRHKFHKMFALSTDVIPRCLNWAVFNCTYIYSSIVFMPWHAFLILSSFSQILV